MRIPWQSERKAMYNLNNKINNLTPYEPLKGDFKIRLDANESFLDIPKHITDEINANLDNLQYNRYPDPMAEDLCNSFAGLFGINPKNVVAGNGSDELISLLFTGFLLKGECFATFENDFSMYRFYGSLSECESVVLNKGENFDIDVDKTIEVCKNSNVKLLIFSNPCNPTSLGLTSLEVCKIIDNLPDTLVVVDEAYMDFWTESVLDKIEVYPNLLILKTCSKAFSMAALRVGFAIGNEKIVNAIKAIKSPYNLNSHSQIMASTVLKHKDEILDGTKTIIKAREDLFSKLSDLKLDFDLLPSNTNFVVLKSTKSTDIFKFLLSKGIAVRCFDAFLRITAGTEKENELTVNSIKEFFAS